MINHNIQSLVFASRNIKDIKEIATICADSQQDFNMLVKCMGSNERDIASMASWAMGHAVQINPDLLDRKSMQNLVGLGNSTPSSAIRRNIMRAIQWAKVPADMQYDVADLALKFLNSQKEDIAVKAFSITVLQNCLKDIPELREEIVFILERDMPHASAAYKQRAKKLLRDAPGIR